MLAPAAIAVSLGIDQIEAPLVAPVALELNGNAITVSKVLFEALLQEAQDDIADPRVTSKALARIVARRRAAGEAPLTFGHVFPFSSHHYQLRLWLRAGHLDPDEDVRLVVVPPPFMVWTLRKGQLDGFCVGAPWNSLAVAAGAGTLLHQGTDIVRDCPEEVLAFRAEWARSHGDDVRALAGAVDDASRWAAAPGNRNSLRTLLTSTAWQDMSPWTIERVLADPTSTSGPAVVETGLQLDEDAIKADPPRRSGSTPRWWRPARPSIRRSRPRPPQPSTLRLSGRRFRAPPPLPLHSTVPRFRQTILLLTSWHCMPQADRRVRCTIHAQRARYFGTLAPSYSLAGAKTGGPGAAAGSKNGVHHAWHEACLPSVGGSAPYGPFRVQ